MTGDLGTALLRTQVGTAFLVVGAASGRLEDALDDVGTTLCLLGHAVREVRRGTDAGRLAQLRADPPRWLLDAAAATAAHDGLGWWSTRADAAPQRMLGAVDGRVLTGSEQVDPAGHRRSAAEEAPAHLHTQLLRDTRDGVPRRAVAAGARLLVIDGPQDWLPLDDVAAEGADGVQLTVRGALTVEPPAAGWPWEVAGTLWRRPEALTPLRDDGPPGWHHDHAWVEVGRPFDPRFDEGDELDGSDLTPYDG